MTESTAPKCKLIADLGGSTLKGIVRLPGQRKGTRIQMNSRTIELDDFQIRNKTVSSGSAMGDAWVSCQGKHYAIGRLAEKYGYDATLNSELSQPKQNLAIPKLCALAGERHYSIKKKLQPRSVIGCCFGRSTAPRSNRSP